MISTSFHLLQYIFPKDQSDARFNNADFFPSLSPFPSFLSLSRTGMEGAHDRTLRV